MTQTSEAAVEASSGRRTRPRLHRTTPRLHRTRPRLHRTTPRLHRAWFVAAVAFVTIIGAAAFRSLPGLLIDPLNHEFGW